MSYKDEYLALVSNQLKMLCADMVQNANSGHPGAPMGLSDIAVVLSQYINLSPSKTSFINRDRLVFSGGHASSLLYALAHLLGFDISLEDLKSFRQLGSKTPGHPEHCLKSGIEITTGPLGQGIANAVGFALASKKAKCMFKSLIDHRVFCICGDGDLQEGISYEASSIAGHHALDNLILIYDSNDISIEGDVNIAFSEDVRARFKAQGFDVFTCDGHNFKQIEDALKQSLESKKPSLIIAKTKIAKGSLSLEGSHKAHGAPLGKEEIIQSKKALNLSLEEFHIGKEIKSFFEEQKQRMQANLSAWQERFSLEEKFNLEENTTLKQRLENLESKKLEFSLEDFKQGENIATRVSNGVILNAISSFNEGFIGGSADLAPSNNTALKNQKDFPDGANMHFGIREHSMGAICNGIANYGIFTPFCATFFVFSDYLSHSIRIASLMESKIFYIFTHDSICVGEDGATHEPIEHLSHLNAMPNLYTFRPSDANENILVWQYALALNAPSAFILSRQNLPVRKKASLKDIQNGGYIVYKSDGKIDLSIIANGSEVQLALDAKELLEANNISVQIISSPSFKLAKQNKDFIKSLVKGTKTLGIFALSSDEWWLFCDEIIHMQSFGASGKGEEVYKSFGFTKENILKVAKSILE